MIKLADFEGKFKVIYCFQSWCPGCHSAGLPNLKKMVNALQDNDKVAFLAVQTVFEGFDRYLPVKPRDRYITDQELDDFCEYAALRHPMASAYMRFRYVTGRRDCEVRSVLFEHVLEEGIIFLIAKRASGGERVPVLMEWTQKLREAFNELVRACWGPEVGEVNTPSYSPPKGEAPVVSYSAGKPYTGEGWRTAFQRLMVGAMKDGVLSRRFTSHDIRAKTATDIEDLADASNTLAHSDIRTTKINYRRKIERIRPLEK